MTERQISTKITTRGTSVETALDYYIEEHVLDRNLKSADVAFHNANHLYDFFKNTKIKQLSPFHIMEYKRARRKKVVNNTIRRELSVLKTALNVSAKDGILTPAEVDHVSQLIIKKPKAQKRQIVPSIDEFNLIMEQLDEPMRRLLFVGHRLAYRKAELLSIKFGDIDWTNRVLNLDETKNGEGRATPLYDEIYEYLCKLHREAQKIYGTDNVNDMPLFRESDGMTPMLKQNTYYRWRKAVKAAKCIKNGKHKYNFHDVARKAGVKYLMLEKKFNRYMIMDCYSGHKDHSVFEGIYNIKTPEDFASYHKIAMQN